MNDNFDLPEENPIVHQFQPGDHVTYVPNHITDINDPACERGIVTRVTENYVFVQYKTGENAKATYPHNLRK